MKRLFFPGFNLGVRGRSRIGRFFLTESGIRTLDVGCGNGYFSAMAARKAGPGSTVLAISFDADQIERCNRFKPYLDAPAERLEFRVADAHTMKGMEEQFDQILLLEVAEHIDDDTVVLREIAQRLKPGGLLHVTTPDIRWGPWMGTLDRHAAGGHCRLGYSSDRLEKVLRDAGLDIAYQVKLGSLGSFLAPLQGRLAGLLGGSAVAEGIAFLCVYPIYLLVRFIPVPQGMKMYRYAVARQRLPRSG